MAEEITEINGINIQVSPSHVNSRWGCGITGYMALIAFKSGISALFFIKLNE